MKSELSIEEPWLGVLLPTHLAGGQDPHEVVGYAALAEIAGFDSVWLGDHLAFRSPILESVVTAATIAARTHSVSIGFGVLQAALRNPLWLAKQLGTLSVLSRERLIVGVGVGGENPREWNALGASVRDRARVTNEFLSDLPTLISGASISLRTSRDGEVSPPLLPAPTRVPPIWIGGRGDAALERAARFGDGWLGLWVDVARLDRSIDMMRRLAGEFDRPSPRAALVVPVVVAESCSSADHVLASFIDAQYGMAFERVSRWCVGGPVDYVSGRLAELLDAGAEGLVAMLIGADAEEQLAGIHEAFRNAAGRVLVRRSA